MRGAEKLVFVRDETAVFQRYAEVKGLFVSDDRAGGHDWLSEIAEPLRRAGWRQGQPDQPGGSTVSQPCRRPIDGNCTRQPVTVVSLA